MILYTNIYLKNVKEITIELLNKIYNSGNEPLQILTNLCEYFKNLLIVKTCNSDMLQDLTGLNSLQIDELKKQKELLETQQIVFLIERISYYIKEIKLAVNQHLWLEVCLIDLSNMAENSKLLELQQRLNAIEVGNIQPISTPQIVILLALNHSLASSKVPNLRIFIW